MAIVPCPECQRDISDRAAACPHCGNPIAAIPSAARVSVQTDDGDVVTTQATGKAPKVVQLVGFLLAVGGVVSCSSSTGSSGGLFLLGCAVFLMGRLMAWWSHG